MAPQSAHYPSQAVKLFILFAIWAHIATPSLLTVIIITMQALIVVGEKNYRCLLDSWLQRLISKLRVYNRDGPERMILCILQSNSYN